MVGQLRPPKSSEVVSLGVAADEQHALALLRHHVTEVGEGEALADAALTVDGDHLGLLLRLRGVRVRIRAGDFGCFGVDVAHAFALQSRIILRQAVSLNAVS